MHYHTPTRRYIMASVRLSGHCPSCSSCRSAGLREAARSIAPSRESRRAARRSYHRQECSSGRSAACQHWTRATRVTNHSQVPGPGPR